MLPPGAKLEQGRQCGPVTSFYPIPAPSSPGREHQSSSGPPPTAREAALCPVAARGDGGQVIPKAEANCLQIPDSSAGKESACNAGDPRSIPGSGRSPGEGKGYPLQYPGLENWTVVHGVTKSWTPLSDFHSETSMAKVRPGPGSPRRHSPRAPGSAPALWGPCPATLLLCSVFLL